MIRGGRHCSALSVKVMKSAAESSCWSLLILTWRMRKEWVPSNVQVCIALGSAGARLCWSQHDEQEARHQEWVLSQVSYHQIIFLFCSKPLLLLCSIVAFARGILLSGHGTQEHCARRVQPVHLFICLCGIYDRLVSLCASSLLNMALIHQCIMYLRCVKEVRPCYVVCICVHAWTEIFADCLSAQYFM